LDKILVAEIEKAKNRGLDINDTKFKVIIELKESDRIRDTIESDKVSFDELEKVVTNEQSPVIERLNEFHGAKNLKVLPFANAIYAELTSDQVQELSNRTDVRAIKLSKEENVTC
jgi:5'(3')-deoxyribonucleotidase